MAKPNATKYTMFFICLFLLCILFVCPLCSDYIILAGSTTTTHHYAQVQRNAVYMYSDSACGNMLFEIPYSYYVRLTDSATDGVYPAQYLTVNGYVLANTVQCVSDIPQTPYATGINFLILATQSSELRSEPTRAKGLTTLICELPLYETNFAYYGKISGEAVVISRGSDWYYCTYQTDGTTYTGYVYGGLCDDLTTIPTQTMSLYPITTHDWSSGTTEEPNEPALELPTNSDLLTILALTIPMFIFGIIMCRTPKNRTSSANPSTPPNSLPLPPNLPVYPAEQYSQIHRVRPDTSNIITLPSRRVAKSESRERASRHCDYYEL